MKIMKKILQRWGKYYRNDVKDVPSNRAWVESREGFPGEVAFVQIQSMSRSLPEGEGC